MPTFRLETNVPREKIPKDFLSQTTKVLAKTLGKPESYCVVVVIPDTLMSWGGTTEPCGLARLMSIGQLGVKENKKHAAALFEHLETTLGIPKDRLYIEYHDAISADVAYNGTTFHEIFG